jgi:hypothetical protein
MYQLLSQYPDKLLEKVLNKMRANGLIVKIKVRKKTCLYLSSFGQLFLAHLTQRVMWAIVTTERPSSVRPLTFLWTIKISSPLFSIFTWWPSWLEVGITGHNFGRGPSKDHSTKVWFKLARWLQRSWLKCEKLTDGRTTDNGRSVVTIWVTDKLKIKKGGMKF